jgi:hypothetical protein
MPEEPPLPMFEDLPPMPEKTFEAPSSKVDRDFLDLLNQMLSERSDAEAENSASENPAADISYLDTLYDLISKRPDRGDEVLIEVEAPTSSPVTGPARPVSRAPAKAPAPPPSSAAASSKLNIDYLGILDDMVKQHGGQPVKGAATGDMEKLGSSLSQELNALDSMIANEGKKLEQMLQDFSGQKPAASSKYPWECGIGELFFRDKLGVGTFGTTFKGLYKNSEVSIKKVSMMLDAEYVRNEVKPLL